MIDPTMRGGSVTRDTLQKNLEQFADLIQRGQTPATPDTLYPTNNELTGGRSSFEGENRYFTKLVDRFSGNTVSEMYQSATVAIEHENRMEHVWQQKRDDGYPALMGFGCVMSGLFGIMCLNSAAPIMGFALMGTAVGLAVGANVPRMVKNHHVRRRDEAQYFAQTLQRWGQALDRDSTTYAAQQAAQVQQVIGQMSSALDKANVTLQTLRRQSADATAAAATAREAARIAMKGHAESAATDNITSELAHEKQAAALNLEIAALEQQVQSYNVQLATLREKATQAGASVLTAEARQAMASASLAAFSLVTDTAPSDETLHQERVAQARLDLSGARAEADAMQLEVNQRKDKLAAEVG